MTITVQQLRSAIPGAQPSSLDPGQVAFNVSDGTMYLGTGADTRTDFSGAQVLPAPPAGKGWIQVLLLREALNEFFLANPVSEGQPAPQDEQVLTWNATEGKAEWQDAGTGFAYVTTSATVATSVGATTSEKISAAIGNPSYIGINASCIVQGDPGTTYEGLYIWDGSQWQFASHFAFNTASQVPAVNPSTLTAASTQEVLNALKVVDDGLQSQITSNDGDISTLQGEVAQAQTNILDLQVNKLNIASNTPTAGQILSFDGAGQLWVDDSEGDVTSVTGTGAITVDNTDAQNPIVELQSNAAGDLLVGDGTGSFGKLAIGNPDEVLVVGPGGLPQWQADSPGDVTSVTGVAPITVDNTDPQTPIVGVDLATTATPGVVQVELTGNLTLVGGVIDVPDASTSVKGAVQLNNTLSSSSTTEALTASQGAALQQQINALNLSNSVTLAGGYDAVTGFVDGVTSQGAAAGYVDGQTPPLASATNVDFYLICIVAGNVPSAMENGDWLLSTESSPGVYNYQVLGVGARPASASYTNAGIVQLADAAAVLAGTSDTTAITPQALQDNIIDSVTTVNSSQMASATAVKTANDNAVAAAATAATAQATADAALPKAGGTMTGTLTGQSINVQATYAIQFAGGTNGTLDGITDSVATTDSTVAASATAVSSAFNAAIGANNAAVAAQTTANTALSDASAAQADATQALADASAAQTTADNAIPKATFTAAGELLYGTGAGTYNVLPIGVDNQQLIVSGGALAWGQGLQGFTEVARTALGVGSLDSITSGVDNVAVGYNTGTSLTTGSRNVFVGDEAGDGVTSGNNNTAVGSGAFSATGGSNNTVLGYAAGGAMTVGNSNTIIGSNAGDALTGANAVVAIGQAALSGATNATGTVAIGQSSLQNLTSGASNTAVGYQTGDTLTTGSANTLLGFNAGTGLQTGGNNILIGAQAGDSITTGSGNTILGDVSGSGALAGNLILAAGATVKFQANDAGAWSADGANYGTAGQVLTSQGDAAVPTWADAPVGLIGVTSGSGEAPYTVALGFGAGDAAVATGFYNVSIGYNAGTNVTTGDYNVGVGGQALQGNGSSNTAVGSSAQGSTNATGQGNSSVGYQTLDALTSGQFNSTIGSASGTSVTSGSRNTLLGYRAGAVITTGGSNTILGAYEGTQALSSNIVLADGDGNVKLQINGPGAWSTNGSSYGTTGQVLTSQGSTGAPTWSDIPAALVGYTTINNTALGVNAGDSLTTGGNNLSVGGFAGTAITSGSNNVLIGNEAGAAINTGVSNTAVGYSALSSATSAGFNVALGLLALGSVSDGQRNIGIGAQCANLLTTGDRNISIGYFAGRGYTTENDNICIGDTQVGVAGDQGFIRIGNSTQDSSIVVNGDGALDISGSGYGTAGQTLTSNGTAAAPTWETPIWRTVSGSSSDTTPYTLLTLPLASATSVQLYLESRDATDATYHNDTYNIITDGTSTDVAKVSGARIGAGVEPVDVTATVSGTDLLIQITNHDAHLVTVQGNYMTTAA